MKYILGEESEKITNNIKTAWKHWDLDTKDIKFISEDGEIIN